MKTNPDILCGGRVDRGFDAPKVIQSKDLTALDTEFFYTEKYGDRGYACLRIKLERDEKNELILSEENRYNVSTEVGNEVLSGTQELIDKFKLSGLNGTDEYTSGLPYPYSPMYFKARYASGESIYFYVDGNPQEPWCNELAEYFLNVFEEYGETSVLPKRESVQIVGFDIEYFDGAVNHAYGNIMTQNNEVKLLKRKYDYNTNESVHEEYIEVPENCYSELEIYLKGLKAYTLINGISDGLFGAKTPGIKKFDICIWHADRSQDFGSFEGEEITPDMLEKIRGIIKFVDKYFES